MEFKTNRFTILGNFGERILNLFKGREKIKFSELVDSLEIRKSKDGEFNKQDLFSLSRNIRDLINKRILSDNNKGILTSSEIFTLTDNGRKLILTEEDKKMIEIERTGRRVEWLEEEIKREKERLKKLKEEKMKND